MKFNDEDLRVYQAESCLFPETEGHHFGTIDEIAAWLSEVIERDWFQREFPSFKGVVVHDGRGSCGARGWRDENGLSHISMPRQMRQQLTVLHELAHGLGHHSHNRFFCRTYLYLVRHALGRMAARDLLENFVAAKVRHRWPPLPPDLRFLS